MSRGLVYNFSSIIAQRISSGFFFLVARGKGVVWSWGRDGSGGRCDRNLVTEQV